MTRTSKQATGNFTFTTGNTVAYQANDPLATMNVLKPDGSPGTVPLQTRTQKTLNSIVNFGGLFEKVDLLVGEVNVFTTNAGPAYYLNGVGLSVNDIDFLGIRIPNSSLVVDGLTNHSALTSSGSWIGKVKMTGSGLEVKAIPGLRFAPAPQKPGDPAFSASYNFNTKQVEATVSNISYTSSDINLSAGGSVKISAAKAAETAAATVSRLDFSGQGSVGLPGLGLAPISGTVGFVLENNSLKNLSASLSTAQTVNDWKIAGDLKFNHNFATKSGSLELANGSIYSIGAKGILNYDSTKLSGSVTLANTAKGGLQYGSFAFTPYEGTLAYTYDSLLKSVGLDFRDVKFGLTLFGKEAIFNGALSLSIATDSGKVSFKSANLTLANDLVWTFEGNTSSGKQSITLTLQANSGTVPTKLEWKNSVYDQALAGELDANGNPLPPAFGQALTFNGSIKVKAPFAGAVEGYVRDLQYAWNDQFDNWSVGAAGFSSAQSASASSSALMAEFAPVAPQFLLTASGEYSQNSSDASLPWIQPTGGSATSSVSATDGLLI